MSVFTPVRYPELRAFLARYNLGTLLGFQGIGEGVENSNFFVDTATGRWVLTLFERLRHEDLPFFLGLMDHLAQRGVPCPRPVRSRDGSTLHEINGRPAAMVNRLTGQSVLFPDPGQCAAVGALLADLHAAGADFSGQAVNTRGPAWRRQTAAAVRPHVEADWQTLLDEALTEDAALDAAALPQGVVHADLFRDNVLFVESRLTGVIDFYYACVDALLWDLAVAVNDWCFRPDGQVVIERYDAMLTAYTNARVPTKAECAAWPAMLRAAALRFWLSRLCDWHFPRDGDVVHVKEPAEYLRILEFHKAQPLAL